MFQNIFQISLSLVAGVLIGWNFHIFYTALEPKKIYYIKKDTPPKENKPIIVKNKKIVKKKIDSNESNNSQIDFEKLLKDNRFDDAMAIYSEANETNLKAYRLIVKVYFYDNGTKYPQKIIDEILHYIELESKSEDIKIYLAKLYRQKKEYQKALEILFELLDTQDESKKIESELHLTIKEYIKHLKKLKKFNQLILFLEDIINRVENNEQYIIILAQIYNQLDNYAESKRVLDDITQESAYLQKAQNILQKIEEKEKEIQQYKYAFPLKRVNRSQYSIDVTINNEPLTLLLDTGATHTLVDNDKIPSLKIIKKIILNTAGGDIVGDIAKADTFNIGELELKNIQISVAPFKDKKIDGLLGMDFFKRFDFKINQNIGILYLSPKN